MVAGKTAVSISQPNKKLINNVKKGGKGVVVVVGFRCKTQTGPGAHLVLFLLQSSSSSLLTSNLTATEL